LFEKALKKAQGPMDSFIPVGELAYIVTFHERTQDEAEIACAAAAREVCALLFGEGAGDISVGGLVGLVPGSPPQSNMRPEVIAVALEQTGKKLLIRSTNTDPDRVSHGVTFAGLAPNPNWFCPIWDMVKLSSSFLLLSPVRGYGRKSPTSIRHLHAHRGDDFVTDLEVRLLQLANEHAHRLQTAGKVCALATGVSWETLGVSGTRHEFLKALKALRFAQKCPLLVKIEDVPGGMPVGRLAEMVAMLTSGGVRALIEFVPDSRIPELDVKLATAGIGTRLPIGCSFEKAKEILGCSTVGF
jgi:hypothetical protein